MDMDAPKAAATIHLRPLSSAPAPPAAAAAHPLLPPLLHTPGGLALLELQGEFNLPLPPPPDALHTQADDEGEGAPAAAAPPPAPPAALSIGRIEFPDYDPTAGGSAAAASTAWMGRVHLYVGPHQRLTGEAKKLPRPLAVVRRRQRLRQAGEAAADDDDADEGTDLEMVDVVHYKLLFSQRPEPMTESHTLE